MYPLVQDKIYVLKQVLENPQAKHRYENMKRSIKFKEEIVLTTKDLDRLVHERQWGKGHKLRTGTYQRKGSPQLIFNTFNWNKWGLKWNEMRYPSLNRALFLGQNPLTFRSEKNHLERNICQAAWELHSVYGCLHACQYCHVEDFVNIMLNIEDLIDYLKKFIPQHPEQQLYKYDNYSDIPVFEPEYNACKPLVEYFGSLKRQFLLLYTKSDNIDYLLDYDHQGQTIINWSISPEYQSRYIEIGTPPLERRLNAMQKCEQAGYTVRARFSPIVPIQDWENATSKMIEQLFSKVNPDVITIDVIGFMDPKTMMSILPANSLDEEANQILNDLSKKHKVYGKHTFPHDFRHKILRHIFNEVERVSPNTPVSICNETPKMWESLSEELGNMTSSNYVCCCGPDSVPGHPLLAKNGKWKE